jgi:hypothetical protein
VILTDYRSTHEKHIQREKERESMGVQGWSSWPKKDGFHSDNSEKNNNTSKYNKYNTATTTPR